MQCPWGDLVVLIFLTYSQKKKEKKKEKPLEVLLVFGNVIHYQNQEYSMIQQKKAMLWLIKIYNNPFHGSSVRTTKLWVLSCNVILRNYDRYKWQRPLQKKRKNTHTKKHKTSSTEHGKTTPSTHSHSLLTVNQNAHLLHYIIKWSLKSAFCDCIQAWQAITLNAQ